MKIYSLDEVRRYFEHHQTIDELIEDFYSEFLAPDDWECYNNAATLFEVIQQRRMVRDLYLDVSEDVVEVIELFAREEVQRDDEAIIAYAKKLVSGAYKSAAEDNGGT